MADSVITWDEIIELYDEDAKVKSYGKTKTIPKSLIKRKQSMKCKFFKLY